jgi:hypothetical protein
MALLQCSLNWVVPTVHLLNALRRRTETALTQAMPGLRILPINLAEA